MSLSAEMKEQLLERALQARQWAYAPYSNYQVGAALLTESGKIYDGVNVESAAYPSSMCAERVAIFKAVSEGERQFQAIAVVTANAGTPCGGCRQVMVEFSMEMPVLIGDDQGNLVYEMTVADLLPGAFTPEDLARG
jgi:cytidine deaminase